MTPLILILSLSLLTPLTLTLSLDLTLLVFFIFLHLPGFELQTSDLKAHLHLHYATQAMFANLLIFVGLISYYIGPRLTFPLWH